MEPSLPEMEESPAKEFVERVITGSRTVRVRFCASLPSELVAVMPTVKVPAFVGVPLIVAPELVDRIAAAQRIERTRPPVAFIDAAWRRDGAEALQAAPFVPGAPLLLATDVHHPARVKAFLAGEQPTSIDMDPIVTGAAALLDRALAAAGDADALKRMSARAQGGAPASSAK